MTHDKSTSSTEEPLFLIGRTEELLGVDRETLMGMGLREFHELCASKGIVPVVGVGGVAPGLTIDFDPEAEAERV